MFGEAVDEVAAAAVSTIPRASDASDRVCCAPADALPVNFVAKVVSELDRLIGLGLGGGKSTSEWLA